MTLEAFLQGMSSVADPWVFGLILAGTLAGVLVGALPGLSSPMAVALLLPFTIGLEPVSALAVMVAVYCGGTFGGSIPAILLNAPGAPPAAATALDGYAMTQRGEGLRALRIAVVSSVCGGVFSLIALALFAPWLADIAVSFRPMELFALSVFALSMLVSVIGDSRVRNLIGGVIGLLIGTVGIHLTTGVSRFEFGQPEFEEGVRFLPVVIGLFAIAELLRQTTDTARSSVVLGTPAHLPHLRDIVSLRWTILRSSVIGTFVGILPAEGSTVASIVGYNEARRWSSRKAEFGIGCPEGVAGPEAANNAATGGALVPTLALGIPGSSTTAVMLTGLGIHGLHPGPHVMTDAPELVYGIVAAMLVANLAILVIGFAGAPVVAQIASIPQSLLWPAVFGLAVIGAYAPGSSVFDVWVMLAAGVMGFLLKRHGFSPMPLLMGLVLAAPVEEALSQSMLILDSQWLRLFESPIVCLFVLLTLVNLGWLQIAMWLRR